MLHSRTITVADMQLSADTAQTVEFLQSWPGFPVLSASHTELATQARTIFMASKWQGYDSDASREPGSAAGKTAKPDGEIPF